MKGSSWLTKLLIVIGTGSLLIVLGYLGRKGFEQWQIRKQEQAAWENIQTFEQQGDYAQCVDQGRTLSDQSPFYNEAQTLIQRCQLAQAEALAANNQIPQAIAILLDYPTDSPEFAKAKSLMDQWSQQILDQAAQQFQAGEWDKAQATLQSLPLKAPATAVVQGLQTQWQAEWQQNETLVKAAQTALEKGEWQVAQESLAKVSATPYWQKKVEPLQKQAETGASEAIAAEPEPPLVEEVSTPAPITEEFKQRWQSLFDTYVGEGMAEGDAGELACKNMGGIMEDRGPEIICVPQ
jgi:soluble cytochrome b562